MNPKLYLGSNFDLDVFMSTRICLDASRCAEHDGGKITSIAFLVQKLLLKNCFCQKRLLAVVANDCYAEKFSECLSRFSKVLGRNF